MSKHTRVSHPIYNLLPTEIEGFASLAELALDMHWSWNHATDEVWRQLDPKLWEITHNPWVVLQTVSRDQIERVLADPVFRKNVDGLVEASRWAAEAPAWFHQNHSRGSSTCAAYFSMEFMLSEALSIYSGGLGNVAGDQLKAASDLGVPVVGVGSSPSGGLSRGPAAVHRGRGKPRDSWYSSHGSQVHVLTWLRSDCRMTKESSMKPANPRILTINGGSSSIKFALFEAGDSLRRILEGGIERIGLPEATLRVKGSNQADNFSRPVTAPDHTTAVGLLMDCIEERSGREH